MLAVLTVVFVFVCLFVFVFEFSVCYRCSLLFVFVFELSCLYVSGYVGGAGPGDGDTLILARCSGGVPAGECR